MRISLAWLREFVNWPGGEKEFAERLTMAGLSVAAIEGQDQETVLDLEITSNRPDCLGHYGVAREVAALFEQTLAHLPHNPASPGEPDLKRQEAAAPAAAALQVYIDAPQACARYCARVLEEVTIGDSPALIQHRLTQMGARPINHLADLTNYTLFETGQPTHAFDADTLRGGELRVRYARSGEKLLCLDEVERVLETSDLVIADAERPVALAGIIGGLETAISAKTRRAVIESAWFEPAGIRRSARRLGLHTDASHRFERGADPEAAPLAADRIAAQAHARGARILAGLIDVHPRRWKAPEIELRQKCLLQWLGNAPPTEPTKQILRRLGFQLENAAAGVWRVRVPSWRPDVRMEADLAEEVARVWGYEQIVPRLPAFSGSVKIAPSQTREKTLRQKLLGAGFSEAMSLSFDSREHCAEFAAELTPVEVTNPLNEEQAWLRVSSLPALLELLLHNQNRGLDAARLFEIGKIYQRREAGHDQGLRVRETRRLAFGGYGPAGGEGAWRERRAFDFYDLKAAAELILSGFSLGRREYQPARAGIWHPGRSAEIRAGGHCVGVLGQLHPRLALSWKFRTAPWVCDLDLEWLLTHGAAARMIAPPSRFPAASRDFSCVFPESVAWESIAAAIEKLELPGLSSVRPVEIFRGQPIPAGMKNLLLRASWQLPDRTLRDEEVQAGAEHIRATLTALGGELR